MAALARAKCDKVVVSIFVNPAQFAPTEDLATYPRTLESDLKKLEELGGVDAVLVPTVQDMYPNGIVLDVEKQQGAFVSVLGFSHQMEGAIRPHFFRGVATVVTKLFNIVQPDYAFFGQKDVQQCVVLKRMATDLLFPLKIVVGPTMREPDGLAMSSRNTYLSPEQRNVATALRNGLIAAEAKYNSGDRSRKGVIEAAEHFIRQQEAVTKGIVQYEYLSLADPDTLVECETIDERGAILSGAIRVGKTRLIDNLLLGTQM